LAASTVAQMAAGSAERLAAQTDGLWAETLAGSRDDWMVENLDVRLAALTVVSMAAQTAVHSAHYSVEPRAGLSAVATAACLAARTVSTKVASWVVSWADWYWVLSSAAMMAAQLAETTAVWKVVQKAAWKGGRLVARWGEHLVEW